MAVAALALVLVLAGVGGVVAWLVSSSQVENQFEVGTVEPDINEDGPTEGTSFKDGDTTKQNVTVTNQGNVPIYVRAQVNIYWIDANGNRLWEGPVEGTGTNCDYTRDGSLPADTGWAQGSDGFYYWIEPLPAGDKTSKLIDKISQSQDQLSRHTDGRKLVVDIAVQGIQADPKDAVIEAWNVNVADGGTLELRTAGEGA